VATQLVAPRVVLSSIELVSLCILGLVMLCVSGDTVSWFSSGGEAHVEVLINSAAKMSAQMMIRGAREQT
jgi:hypothetical protein